MESFEVSAPEDGVKDLLNSAANELTDAQFSISYLMDDLPLVVLSTVLPFLFALFFFSVCFFSSPSSVNENYQYQVQHNTLTKLVFASTFTVTFMLQELIVFEIIDALHPRTRWLLWKLSFFLVSLDCLLVIPGLIFFAMFFKIKSWSLQLRVLSVLFFEYIFLMLFFSVGNRMSFLKADDSPRISLNFSLEFCVACIGVFGIFTVAVLSGFGAVYAAYTHLRIFLHDYSESDIFALESRLFSVVDTISLKQQELEQAEHELERRKFVLRSRSGSLRGTFGMGGVFPLSLFTWDDSEKKLREEIDTLRTHIIALRDIKMEMSRDVAELKAERTQMQFSRTRMGKLWYFLGYIFTIYCIYRLCFATVNILFARDPTNDPITRLFELSFMLFGIEVHETLAQLASFILIGVLVFNSVRGFLSTMSKAIRNLKFFFPLTSAVSPNLVVLVMCEVMGMYFVSSVLLLRMSLPLKYRQVITEVLGNIQFNYYHRWFERIFLASATVSLILLFGLTRQSKMRAQMYGTPDKDA